MSDLTRQTLTRQLSMAWKLLSIHLDGLTTDECLWRPADHGLHVTHDVARGWIADWPDRESYDLGPSTIAWLTWHTDFWWSMVLDHSFGKATLTREEIPWRGSSEDVRERLQLLYANWTASLEGLTDDEWYAATHTRWPFQDKPFADVVAWANLELMKSASEIGYVRFLYAARTR